MGEEVIVDVSTWYDERNLPPPVGDTVPAETAIYLAIISVRRMSDVPVEVLTHLASLFGTLTVGEA